MYLMGTRPDSSIRIGPYRRPAFKTDNKSDHTRFPSFPSRSIHPSSSSSLFSPISFLTAHPLLALHSLLSLYLCFLHFIVEAHTKVLLSYFLRSNSYTKSRVFYSLVYWMTLFAEQSFCFAIVMFFFSFIFFMIY